MRAQFTRQTVNWLALAVCAVSFLMTTLQCRADDTGIYQAVHYEHRKAQPAGNIGNPLLAGSAVEYTWTSLEPREGEYHWDDLDNYIRLWGSHGKKVIVGIVLYTKGGADPTQERATPQWVFDAGAKSIHLTSTKGSTTWHLVWPVMWDRIFLEKYERLIHAFAEHYDGNPNIAAVDVGLGLFSTTRLTLPNPKGAEQLFAKQGYNKEVWIDTIHRVTGFYRQSFHRTRLRFLVAYFTGHNKYAGDDSFPQVRQLALEAAAAHMIVFLHDVRGNSWFLDQPWLGLYDEIHRKYPHALLWLGTDNPTYHNNALGTIASVVQAAFGGKIGGKTYPQSHISSFELYFEDVSRATSGDPAYANALKTVSARLRKQRE